MSEELNNEPLYDSTSDTLKHIKGVNDVLCTIADVLKERGVEHDASKLRSPEKEMYDTYVPKLRSAKYNSPEYHQILSDMAEAGLNHHYQFNSHHPEHYENGVNDMSLFDIIEMFADHTISINAGDDIEKFKSALRNNASRFGFSKQLEYILFNTYLELIGRDK